jgi:hypothetical protein
MMLSLKNDSCYYSLCGNGKFIPESHEYYLLDNNIPGISRILDSCKITDYSMVKEDNLEYARIRGTAAHEGARLLDLGTLDESSTDDGTMTLIASWKKACEQAGWKDWTYIETPIINTKLRYGCIPDRYKISTEMRGSKEVNYLTVVEIKTNASLNIVAVEIQLSAQEMAICSCYEEMAFKVKRYVVHLNKNYKAGYKIIECKNDRRNDFVSCLNVYRLQKKD